MMCVLQLNDAIFYFSLNDDKHWAELSQSDSKDSMKKILMVRGPFEEIYYAETNVQTGDQIVRLTFKSKDRLTKDPVKKYGNTKILGMNMLHDEVYNQENFRKHSIIVLDEDGFLSQFAFADSDSNAKQIMQKNIHSHDSFGRIEQYLR